ncbi:MAG: preprotein translocase subunit SecA [Hydrotalea flava]|uniref:preprotein translocase subunit SecA n=2 Tax=Hydrotalea TaxID=1004300 RepID=UPI0016B69721|nr:preprotein translocase subunit SecA [Hydrotalea lipotrueae]NIM35447.1 preprotein translocase subunit SecA [Hydrotalea flava]GHU74914.1 protein translocase subunit SecA [Spirochaetia bacterium]NIM38305.1 preprotein translocase subunit SecA [Hydrotalea flava]NIN03476.1 preprotein translocase subunit SecA [Hydrotalea flava]NIN15163.1 preprotein translocase subunit SecA [Hydrotalea flava]
MLKLMSKILGGNKSEKDVQKILPIVQKINQFYEQYKTLSNDALRNKTVEFKAKIKAHLTEIDDEIALLQQEADALPPTEIHEKDKLYHQLDKLKKERDKHIETVLNEILPEAFAVVKETARRFKENETLVATASDLDRELSVKKDYITIRNNEVVFNNNWMAAGGKVVWNMLHYDVQLIGGVVLHQGKIAEMATGEGKTLVSSLPAYLNALAGEGVHIVTVNDYLARRDSEWNGPIFEFLGLKVDCIDKHDPNTENRRNAYLADIVYGTNNEFGFDYLRDNMVHSPDEMVQRKFHYAIIDEVDSVLIDDARTPLIISGPIGKQDNIEQFFELKPRIEKLVEAQKKAVNQFLIEAKKKIAEGNDDPKDGGLLLYRAFRGLPKNNALIKYLSEPGMRMKLQKAENYYMADQSREMHIVDAELYFYIDEKNNSVELTDKGINLITKSGEDPHFFILPDISVALGEIEQNNTLSAEEKIHKKEVLINEYAQKADRIHTVQQLLKAYTLFEKDDEYVVLDGQVKIVDEQTGRILDGRRYSDGLHQAIEAKENVKIEATTQTYATVTLQNYFRMYHKLAGMTGTAQTEAAELWDIYKLDVVAIPTNVPVIRKDSNDLVFKTKREKFGAVIEEILNLQKNGRPVLVGTTSVEVSELLSRMLRQKQIAHNVLNAKQHAREAQIIAEAGMAGAITIATNMAGRGTDIKLGPGVKEAGGLAILGTERHESRRVDLQLRGRAGRQGDPGSSVFFVSLEDDLMRMFGSDRIAKVMDFAGYKEGEVIQHSMITKSIERAQKKVEENNFGIRKRLLEYDDVMNKQRTVIYTKRSHALFGERLALDLDNAFYSVAAEIINGFKVEDDFEGLRLACIVHFGTDTNITPEELNKLSEQQLTEKLYNQAITNYQSKKVELATQTLPVFKNIRQQQGAHIENVIVPFGDGRKQLQVLANMQKTLDTNGIELVNALERSVTLAFIDDAWKEHLRAMDDLKQSVQTAAYEQKDPLVIYKMEAFNLFKQMDSEVNKEIVQFLCHATIPLQEGETVREGRQRKTDLSNMRTQKESLNGAVREDDYYDPTPVKQEPVKVGPKIGRNDPCPCGSGKKYKNCHGKEA